MSDVRSRSNVIEGRTQNASFDGNRTNDISKDHFHLPYSDDRTNQISVIDRSHDFSQITDNQEILERPKNINRTNLGKNRHKDQKIPLKDERFKFSHDE